VVWGGDPSLCSALCETSGVLGLVLGSPAEEAYMHWSKSSQGSKLIKGFEHLTYNERLRMLGLLSWKARKLSVDPTHVYKHPSGGE